MTPEAIASLILSLGGMMGGWKNPASSAMPYLQQMGPYSSTVYSPYMQTGLGAMNQYFNNAASWATPQGAMNNYNTIAGGWQGSPAQTYDIDQANQSVSQQAAASGQAGTPSTQEAVAAQTEAISNKYMQDFVNSILGIQNQGQEGLGNLTHLGFQAANNNVQDVLKMLGLEGGASYMGTMNQNAYNQSPQGVLNTLTFGLL